QTVTLAATGSATLTASATGLTDGSLTVQVVQQNAAEMQGIDLVVAGSARNDTIVVRPTNAAGSEVQVLIGKVILGPFSPVGSILGYGLGGSDILRVDVGQVDTSAAGARVAVPVFLFGGDGNDTLIAAGAQAAVLVGGAGNDGLIGGAGNDLLLG